MFEDDDDSDMEAAADEYSILTEAGFSEDQADAIVAAIRACQSKDTEEAPEAKKDVGSDALALLIGTAKPKKK
jgi:hypothetical protein